MNKEKFLLEHYNLRPLRISYKNNTKMIETDKGKFAIKLKDNNNNRIYEYLKSRNFHSFLPLENKEEDPIEIYSYIEERKLSAEDKAIDLVYVLSMLHIKTTTYQEIDLDKTKETYEQTLEKISYLNIYYHDLQDYIENKIYMSPAEYLLMRNISRIYATLNYAKETIEIWYQEKIKLKRERLVQLHNDVSLDHFLETENSYLINWHKSQKGIVIYDFLNFYQNEYLILEMNSLFDLYQSKYQYTKEEKLLFLSLLAIPWKIEFKDSNYINTLNVRKLVTYLLKSQQLILKENEKNQKAQ